MLPNVYRCPGCLAPISSYMERCYDCRKIQAAHRQAVMKAGLPKPTLPNTNPADVLRFWGSR